MEDARRFIAEGFKMMAPCSPRRSLRGRPYHRRDQKAGRRQAEDRRGRQSGAGSSPARARGQVGSEEGPERAVPSRRSASSGSRSPLYGYDFEGLGRAAQAHHSPCGRRRAERLRSTSTVTSSSTTASDIYQDGRGALRRLRAEPEGSGHCGGGDKIYPTPGLMVWVWPPPCIWRAPSATAPSSSTATILPTGPTRCVT